MEKKKTADAAGRAAKPKTIVFFHPDLGIGGAERLVVDAAVGLQQRGHRVVIFTSHCDPTHCFDEVRAGPGGQPAVLDVRVRGGSVVPPSVLGRLAILCAIARQTHLLLQIWLTGELAALQPAAYFVDQLSAGVPLLRAIGAGIGAGIGGGIGGGCPLLLFYCHFPDLLLVQGRQRWWKRLYRVPFDALEQWSMGFADAVAVNSRFTRGVVSETWPRLAAQTDLQVVYPCIGEDEEDEDDEQGKGPVDLWPGTPFVLSINRFERKKDIGLAVRAFAGLPAEVAAQSRLVVAGGYDPRIAENLEYHAELVALADALGLRAATATTTAAALATDPDVQVLFLLSVPSALKARLLRTARLLVYTPSREHFGIVPLEAMRVGVPVLACDSGGPTETVVDGQTGWLRSPDDVPAWTQVLAKVLAPPRIGTSTDDASLGLSAKERAAMAAAGRSRVRSQFALAQMAARLDGIYDELERGPPAKTRGASLVGPLVVVVLATLLVALLGILLGAIVLKGKR